MPSSISFVKSLKCIVLTSNSYNLYKKEQLYMLQI